MSPPAGGSTVARPSGGTDAEAAVPGSGGRASVAAPLLGAAGSVVGLLVGGWLMLAPFALGYQPSGADWSDTTVTDFFTGLGVAVVAALAVVAFVVSLVARLRPVNAPAPRAPSREARTHTVPPEPGLPSGPRPPDGDDAVAAASTGDLATLLEPLVRALQEDLAAAGDARQPVDPSAAASRRSYP